MCGGCCDGDGGRVALMKVSRVMTETEAMVISMLSLR